MPWFIGGLPGLIFSLVRWLVVRLAYRGVFVVIDRSSLLFAQVATVMMIVIGGALIVMEPSEPAPQPSLDQSIEETEDSGSDESELTGA